MPHHCRLTGNAVLGKAGNIGDAADLSVHIGALEPAHELNVAAAGDRDQAVATDRSLRVHIGVAAGMGGLPAPREHLRPQGRDGDQPLAISSPVFWSTDFIESLTLPRSSKPTSLTLTS